MAKCLKGRIGQLTQWEGQRTDLELPENFPEVRNFAQLELVENFPQVERAAEIPHVDKER